MSEQHNFEIHENRASWERKPVLRQVYADFYSLLSLNLASTRGGFKNLELGSGMGNIKKFIPNCITSDIFPNPWLDRIENAYQINMPDFSLANLILFDVWHHLQYPANALAEAARVLKPGGNLLVLDPAMSTTGRFVYGLFHHEPLGFKVGFKSKPIDLQNPSELPYFAAQSSAHRLLVRRELPELLDGWDVVKIVKITSFAYLASGGFRGLQLYPDIFYPIVRVMDRLLGFFPKLFAARLLVILKKKSA